MNILLGFSPWLLFWFLAVRYPVTWAAGLGLILSLIVNLRSVWKGKVRILEIGSFVFLSALTVASLFIHADTFRHWAHMMVNGAMFLTALISIIIKDPFIFRYVREEAPDEKKDSPELYHACLTITRVWTFLFLFMMFTATAKIFWKNQISWIIVAGHTLLFMGAMVFTRLYRKKYE